MLVRPHALNLSERTVLDAALAAWLDRLQAEALRRAGTHPVWKQVAHGFDAGLRPQARDRFQQEFRGFELKETDELERAGRELTEGLEKNPALLTTLRGGKLAADVAVVGRRSSVPTWPPNWWLPAAAPAGRLGHAPGGGAGGPPAVEVARDAGPERAARRWSRST